MYFSDETAPPVYRIYDPENELQELFDEASTWMARFEVSESDNIRALFDDMVVTIIDEDTGMDFRGSLGNLRPYSHRSEPMQGDTFSIS